MYKIIKKLLPVIFLVLSLNVMAQENTGLNLEQLVQEAIENNPQLKAARNRTQAARTRIRQVKAWDAPQIGIEFYQTPVQSFPDPIKNGMETDYFIQQMFPFPGKLSAMGESAQKNAGMIDQEYKSLERKIILELKTGYYELYLVQRKLSINSENQELMKKFIEIALKQYEVGMGIQADILRAQTELSTLKNEEINLQQQQKIVTGMINVLMNHPVTDFLGMIAEIQPAVPQWTFDQLQPIALENRPELSGMRYAVGMNVAELSLSRREYYPDLMTKLMYKNMTDTRNDFWSVMIGINFPLAFWSSRKYTSQVEENKLRVAEAENDQDQMKNMIQYEVQTALVKWQSSYNTLQLYKSTSIPQAEQTLQSTLTAYQTGKTEFLMVIDAYRMLLMVKLDYQMSLMNYLTSLAELEQAVGMDVDKIEKYIHSNYTKEK